MDLTKRLRRLGACSEALEWCKGKTLAAAWRECKRGDWMLWLLDALSVKSESAAWRKLILTACECARLVLVYVAESEHRPLAAIETAERWARRKKNVTLTDVSRAAARADAVSTDAAYAAATAAYVGVHAGDVAVYAVVEAVADAADVEGGSRYQAFAQCADIVRKHYPTPPRLSKKVG